jgi:hypothetical protein
MPDLCCTDQPFTVAVCMRCSMETEPLLMKLLRGVVRQCPHGILVAAQCLLGEFTCAGGYPSKGSMLLLQPCSANRTPNSAAIWIGPVDTDADAKIVSEWVAAGNWDCVGLPRRLRADLNLARGGHLN